MFTKRKPATGMIIGKENIASTCQMQGAEYFRLYALAMRQGQYETAKQLQDKASQHYRNARFFMGLTN